MEAVPSRSGRARSRTGHRPEGMTTRTMVIDEIDMRTRVAEVLNRWPTAGLAVGVVREGSLGWFLGHGVADIRSGAPVDEDTVFRIASVTKTITAIAVMQLREQGLVDLDAPASDYLRGYSLVPAKAGFRPPTLRHLLTHTAGVRAVRTPSDLLRPELGWSAQEGGPLPSLADYYRGGLRVDVEPGTKWAYSNHGFATLGQIVEDVSGLPFDRYLRERVFDPLGMESSDLVRSERVRSRLATGYALRSGGLKAVADREIATAGASGAYSSMRDMARYLSALLGGGANEHGSVLRPETLAQMFEPHHQPDPRIPGMGLGFFRDEVDGHRTVAHDGIWKGFSLRHGARSRRGDRCARVRQHRLVRPPRRAGARREGAAPSAPRPPG
jgi:CubicO group peptidase (beta-lactamase class C family)